jgi:molybdate transport system substrate-binding protein
LPADIQSYTTYAGAIGANVRAGEAAKELLRTLASPAAASVLRAKGMEPA